MQPEPDITKNMDNYIEGINDKTAPFNQPDIVCPCGDQIDVLYWSDIQKTWVCEKCLEAEEE